HPCAVLLDHLVQRVDLGGVVERVLHPRAAALLHPKAQPLAAIALHQPTDLGHRARGQGHGLFTGNAEHACLLPPEPRRSGPEFHCPTPPRPRRPPVSPPVPEAPPPQAAPAPPAARCPAARRSRPAAAPAGPAPAPPLRPARATSA